MNGGHYDVAVVGAGLSGLTAARALIAQGKRVVVLEARDRPGGRTWTTQSAAGLPVDIGGQWVGPTQHRALALIERLGLSTINQFDSGRNILEIAGRRRLFSGTIPTVSPWGLIDLQLAIWRLQKMSRSLVPDAPWRADKAAEWDAITVEHWLHRSLRTETARRLLRISVNAVYAVEPRDLSMLQFLFYIRAAGGLMPLIEARGGAQDRRIVGGAQQLSERLADEARDMGAVIRYQQPVDRVVVAGGTVRIESGDESFHADRLVIAMAPVAAERIDFEPALPVARRFLMARMPMGSVIKCIALYPKPFWRERGLSGEMVTDEGPLRMCFDVTSAAGTPGGLVGFVLGAAARQWSDAGPDARRRAVCAQLARHFGAEAGQPGEFIEQDWCADPWALGCYVGHPAPGVWTAAGESLRKAVGPLHWAGTETATCWNGYMDGAIEAGERAAAEVTEAI